MGASYSTKLSIFEEAASAHYIVLYRTWQLIKNPVNLISKHRNGSSKDVKCPSVNCWSQLIFFIYSKLKGNKLIYFFSIIPHWNWLNKWSWFCYFQFAIVDDVNQDCNRLERDLRLKWNDGILIYVVLMTSHFSKCTDYSIATYSSLMRLKWMESVEIAWRSILWSCHKLIEKQILFRALQETLELKMMNCIWHDFESNCIENEMKSILHISIQVNWKYFYVI